MSTTQPFNYQNCPLYPQPNYGDLLWLISGFVGMANTQKTEWKKLLDPHGHVILTPSLLILFSFLCRTDELLTSIYGFNCKLNQFVFLVWFISSTWILVCTFRKLKFSNTEQKGEPKEKNKKKCSSRVASQQILIPRTKIESRSWDPFWGSEKCVSTRGMPTAWQSLPGWTTGWSSASNTSARQTVCTGETHWSGERREG